MQGGKGAKGQRREGATTALHLRHTVLAACGVAAIALLHDSTASTAGSLYPHITLLLATHNPVAAIGWGDAHAGLAAAPCSVAGGPVREVQHTAEGRAWGERVLTPAVACA